MIRNILKLQQLVPPHKTMVELGGASQPLFLTQPRSKIEVYNDERGEVANLCLMLRGAATMQQLSDYLYGRPNSQGGEVSSAIIRAARFFENCQAALRQCKDTPLSYGERFDRCFHGTMDYYLPVIERWHNVGVENKPWDDLIHRYDSSQTCFVIHRDTAAVDDHELLRKLQTVRGRVQVCGPNLQVLHDLPEGWSGTAYGGMVAADPLKRGDPAQVVWTNYSISR